MFFFARPVLNASLAQGKRKFLFRSFCQSGQASLQVSRSNILTAPYSSILFGIFWPKEEERVRTPKLPFPIMVLVLYVFDSASISFCMDTFITGINRQGFPWNMFIFLAAVLKMNWICRTGWNTETIKYPHWDPLHNDPKIDLVEHEENPEERRKLKGGRKVISTNTPATMFWSTPMSCYFPINKSTFGWFGLIVSSFILSTQFHTKFRKKHVHYIPCASPSQPNKHPLFFLSLLVKHPRFRTNLSTTFRGSEMWFLIRSSVKWNDNRPKP